MVSGEELEGSLGIVSGRTVGLHSHHPLVVWTRSELVEGGKKRANQKRRITAGRERAVTETAVCPVPLVCMHLEWTGVMELTVTQYSYPLGQGEVLLFGFERRYSARR